MLQSNASQNLVRLRVTDLRIDMDDCRLYVTASISSNNVFYPLMKRFCSEVSFCRLSVAYQSNPQKCEFTFLAGDSFKLRALFYEA